MTIRRIMSLALLSTVMTVGAGFAITVTLRAHGMLLANTDYWTAHRVVWLLIRELSK